MHAVSIPPKAEPYWKHSSQHTAILTLCHAGVFGRQWWWGGGGAAESLRWRGGARGGRLWGGANRFVGCLSSNDAHKHACH
jgi:hypothetical protein